MKKYTMEQIKTAIDNYTNLVIEGVDKIETGVGEAVDLTAKLIQIGKIKSGGESLKKSIINFLTITYAQPKTNQNKLSTR